MIEKVDLVISILEMKIARCIGELNLASDIHLSLEVVLETKKPEESEWEYYIVDHATQHILWVDEHKLTTHIYQGAESEAHIGKLF